MYEYSHVTELEFEHLKQLGYVLIEFYADWCGTCRSVTRMLKHLESLNVVPIVRVDIEKNKILMKKYNIIGVPVIVLLNHETEVSRIGGSLNFEEFKDWIHQVDYFKELS